MDSGSQSSHYALQVALQTMKERCVALQKRVTTVEFENHSLRERLQEKNSSQDSKTSESLMENNQLRMQIVELNRQKNQLSEHLTMVSNENRTLWSRLSQISKDQERADQSNTTLVNDNDNVEVDGSPRSSVHQNLIRSKTFTQHSPNPNLRHKLITNKVSNGNSQMESDVSKISLEEIDLGKNDENENTPEGIGFGYPNDYSEEQETLEIDEVGEATDLKKLIEGMRDLKRLAQEQFEEMTMAKQAIKINKAKVCNECIKKSQKPEMADKSLETDESLHEQVNQLLPQSNVTNILTDDATECDQICPICGKKYDNISFDKFEEHVEYHFLDESSDVDQSLERNFEYISHAVGDF